VLQSFRHHHRTQAYYGNEEDPEVSSYFSEVPLTDVLYPNDPYAAFDPDVSAASEDDNREPAAESSTVQPSFKKIGEQWGAMVTPQSTDHRDRPNQYSEERSGRRGTSSRRRNRSGWRRSGTMQSSPEPFPEVSKPHEAVSTSSRVKHFVNAEVQTTTEDVRLSSPAVVVGGGISHCTKPAAREMIDSEVQCSRRTASALKKEYIRSLFFTCTQFVIHSIKTLAFFGDTV